MDNKAETLERWRDLRLMLNQQLKMFEAGTLSLHSNDMDVAPVRVDELKGQISAYDQLIAERLAVDASR